MTISLAAEMRRRPIGERIRAIDPFLSLSRSVPSLDGGLGSLGGLGGLGGHGGLEGLGGFGGFGGWTGLT